MSKRMHRSQILLEPEQHKALAEIAEEKQRSISEIVREILREWLAEKKRFEQHKQELEALHKLTDIRHSIQEVKGNYIGDLIEEIREARQEDLKQVWRESQ